jgi:hypothetical protein
MFAMNTCPAEAGIPAAEDKMSPEHSCSAPSFKKNTGDFKGDEKFVPGLKPRLRLLSVAAFLLGPPAPRQSHFVALGFARSGHRSLGFSRSRLQFSDTRSSAWEGKASAEPVVVGLASLNLCSVIPNASC